MLTNGTSNLTVEWAKKNWDLWKSSLCSNFAMMNVRVMKSGQIHRKESGTMSEPRKCADTLNDPILSTSQPVPTGAPDDCAKSGKKRQKRQQEIENDVDVTPERFQPFDLKSLTFKPIGSEQEVNIWYAAPDVFHAYVSQFASGFRKINTDLWPLAERLALVNTIWRFCEEHGEMFPFMLRQQVVPDVNIDDIPLVNVMTSEAASEAV
jgi:hypothetical protein